MNIIELLQQDNLKLKHVAATSGGEFHGECPKCGGNDRFLSWPNDRPEKGGKFYCRQCKFSGDAITYLIEIRKMSYKEACLELNIEPNFKYDSKPKTEEKVNQPWEPRTVNQVCSTWSDKAEAILFQCFKTIMSASGKSTRDYLSVRGINTDTIKQARIGLNLSDLTFDRQTWGLPLPEKKDGLNSQIWIPAGIIIPMFYLGRVVRLRIRQSNPKKSDRYILVAGSATAYLQHNPEFNPALPSMVVESELDGWLVHQEAASLVNVFSIGNSTARPDNDTHSKIKQTPIFIALDHDAAGKNETLWWKNQYKNSLPWPSIAGKDPGEDYQAGTDLKAWVSAGCDILSGAAQPISQPVNQSDIMQADIVSGPVPDIEIPNIQIQQFKRTIHCMHNQPCVSLGYIQSISSQFEKPVCLIRDNRQAEEEIDSITSIYSMRECPKNKWHRVNNLNGGFYEIIIGMGVKK
ncbi:MAG: primase-helicase zinc-binding domain-containing protein [Smithella sp.]